MATTMKSPAALETTGAKSIAMLSKVWEHLARILRPSAQRESTGESWAAPQPTGFKKGC